MKSLGSTIRDLRKERGITQPQLAKALNVSNGIISIWENNINEPKATYIKKLALFFDVSTDYLLGLEDESGAKYINSFNNFNNNGNINIK